MLKKKYKTKTKQKQNTELTDTENRLVVVRGGAGGWRNG